MATYGQFTDYEPLPDLPGAYSFKRGSESPLTFGGPEAERLKAKLDAAKAVTQTAGGKAAGGFQISGLAGKLHQQGVAQGQAEVASLAPPPDAASSAAPTGNQDIGLGYYRDAAGRIHERKVIAGSPGVSKEQLQKADENAVPVRKGEQEVVQQGTPQSQEFLDTQSALNQAESDALTKERDDQLEAARQQAEAAKQQFEQTQRMQTEENARLAELQRKFGQEEALKNKAMQDYTASRVKPGQVFMNPIGGLASILASAGGAYAATIAKTPNFAQQIIDQATNQDIAAQEAAIRIKGDKANNLVSELRQRGMSVEQARATAKQIQIQYESQKLEALRAKNAVPALEDHYNKISIGLQKAWNEADEASRVAGQDKVTRQTTKGFEHEKAATAGGTVDRTLGGKEGLEVLKEFQGLKKGEQELNKAPPVSIEQRKVDQSLAGLSSDQARLAPYGDEARPLTEENRSAPVRSLIGGTNDFLGAGTWQDLFYSDQDKQFIQDFEGAKGNLIAGISVANAQGAMQEGERHEAEKRIAAAGTVGELKRAQAWVRDKLERQREAAKANPGSGTTIEVSK